MNGRANNNGNARFNRQDSGYRWDHRDSNPTQETNSKRVDKSGNSQIFREKAPDKKGGGGKCCTDVFVGVGAQHKKVHHYLQSTLSGARNPKTSARCSRKRSFVKQNKTQRHTFCVSGTMLKRDDFFRKKTTSLKNASWRAAARRTDAAARHQGICNNSASLKTSTLMARGSRGAPRRSAPKRDVGFPDVQNFSFGKNRPGTSQFKNFRPFFPGFFLI